MPIQDNLRSFQPTIRIPVNSLANFIPRYMT